MKQVALQFLGMITGFILAAGLTTLAYLIFK